MVRNSTCPYFGPQPSVLAAALVERAQNVQPIHRPHRHFPRNFSQLYPTIPRSAIPSHTDSGTIPRPPFFPKKPPPSRSPSRRRLAGWTPNRNKKSLPKEGFLGRGRGGGISFFEKKSLPRKNIPFYSQSLFSAASKATSEGSKFTLWVKSQASLAPNMRSMPESSHSTQSGPW